MSENALLRIFQSSPSTTDRNALYGLVRRAPKPNYGKRADGTDKGAGFFGELKRPDGNISTELSIGVDFDGREVQIPALVPTLSRGEINYLLGGGAPTPEIVNKAAHYAIERRRKGLSPFAGPLDLYPIPEK